MPAAWRLRNGMTGGSNSMRLSFLILAVALAGCLGPHNDPFPVNPEGADAILIAIGPIPANVDAIPVDEALSRVGGDAVLVQGALMIDDANHTIWLCAGIDLAPANDPPQPPSCDGPSLSVELAGDPRPDFTSAVLGAASVNDLQTIANVRWAEDASLFGNVVWPPPDRGG
jgi:hypothetical protein